MKYRIEKATLFKRLEKYVSIETTSDPNSNLHPSSEKEFDLIYELEKEMKKLNLKDVYVSKYAYVYGHLEKNTDKPFNTIGFISHVDTSPDASGKNVKAVLHKNYQGGDIKLNDDVITKESEFPFLKLLKGRDIVTSDGTTLLGADDKAGIAEILSVIEYLNKHPEIEHGDIYVAFTPDEEIGEGTMFFEMDKFPCDFAYTVDGSIEGEIAYENFNAASAVVTIKGINIHPGSAKDHMINSILVAYEFNSMLDPDMVPSKTEGREGFNHLNNMEGNVEETKLYYIIRNHDKDKFNAQKQAFIDIQNTINKKYNKNLVEVTIKDSYYNMFDIIKDHMESVDIAKIAIKDAGANLYVEPIRGGTDGATLTYKGLICPNLGTGGFNFHGKHELISLEGMQIASEIILNIINLSKK